MPLQADQGNFQSRGHERDRDHRLTTLPGAELWDSGSVFILKIPTINYKKFKELKTSQERDTRHSGDDSIAFTSKTHGIMKTHLNTSKDGFTVSELYVKGYFIFYRS